MEGKKGTIWRYAFSILFIAGIFIMAQPAYAIDTGQGLAEFLTATGGYQVSSTIMTVSPNKQFTVQFNQPVDFNSVNDSNLQLIAKDTGAIINLDYLPGNDNKSIKIIPWQLLSSGKSYYLIVHNNYTIINGSTTENTGSNIKTSGGNKLTTGYIKEVAAEDIQITNVEFYNSLTPGKKSVVIKLSVANPEKYRVNLGETELYYDAQYQEFYGDIDVNVSETSVRTDIQVSTR